MQLMFVQTAEEMIGAGQVIARSVMIGMDTETQPNRRANCKPHKTSLLQVISHTYGSAYIDNALTLLTVYLFADSYT
jgi:hypothetical protein